MSLEFLCGLSVEEDRFACTADIDLAPGDVLRAHEPLAGHG